ncbi:MAG: SRPBCC family protein [Actinomycetota bacterium]|nr:SRPBCC family protein [Actinomycetota bacterium]
MRRASAEDSFAASVSEAESRWYDTERWPAWIDGLSRVTELEGEWPRAGAKVTWESNPAGRGRVVELVVRYEPLVGQTVEVQDDSIRGRQSVAFHELDGGVGMELALEYELKQRSILTPVIDALFIRRAMTASLGATLSRFGVELAGAGARA